MAYAKPNQTKQGFTLVELSIVIVIIGLIIAGVTAGASLVHSARLRQVLTAEQMYVSAENAFKMQYNGLAGDITNATSYWPAAGTNNGNGDGYVVGSWEGVCMWQHLRLAGLIQNGQYDCIGATPGTVGKTWGVSGYSGTVGFVMFTLGMSANGWGYLTSPVYGKTGNIVFGLGALGTTLYVNNAALTPNDAYGIDLKIDDGIPNTGKVMADNGGDTGITTCTNGANASAAGIAAGTAVSYLNNNTVGCRMMFVYK